MRLTVTFVVHIHGTPLRRSVIPIGGRAAINLQNLSLNRHLCFKYSAQTERPYVHEIDFNY